MNSNSNQSVHVPVLLHEVLEALKLREGMVFLDGTLGGAGHSAAVAEALKGKLTLIGLDRDREALKRSEERLRTLHAKTYLKEESFRNLDKVLEEINKESAPTSVRLSAIGAPTLKGVGVDAILLDLGISSDQLESGGRGFTFQHDEPLLMTMKQDPSEGDLTARDILNSFDESALELIIRGFGEEKYSRQIAREIVKRRELTPFETTTDLLEAVRAAVPPLYRNGRRLNPATKTFQALRIAVNEELQSLEEGLEKGFEILNSQGRFAVISFHSLEDRIVKNFFRDRVKSGQAHLITKKPITASKEELALNPRARSAKLRVIEKI